MTLTHALILLPAAAGVAAFFLKPNPLRRALLVLTALTHTLLAAATIALNPGWDADGWLGFDPAGLLFLGVTSTLFLAIAIYAAGYLARESRSAQPDIQEHFLFVNAPEAVFTGCLLLFLASMTVVCASRRFGLLWVAIETTTLVSAPLIYFHRHHRSLEATWKYLLICSVGIALALLGNFFLALASVPAPAGSAEPLPLILDVLLKNGSAMQASWLRAAFIFFLVGYGTKAGLAPLHTWLPDAHSEAPSLVGALLSGALLNCALLGILRGFQVCAAAGQAEFARELLVVFGLFSLAVAAVFILGQSDYKRMLAYSSVGHMGVVAFGLGVGSAAGTFGAMLHTVNHSFAKGMLFLVGGNLMAAFHSKKTADVSGAFRVLPVSGVLWFAGFLALAGMPPFGMFMSEFNILSAAISSGRHVVAGVYLLLLAVIFIGMSLIFMRMTFGEPAAGTAPLPDPAARREPLDRLLPPLLLGLPVLLLGMWIPPWVGAILNGIVAALGGN